jgi:hypothetical protein
MTNSPDDETTPSTENDSGDGDIGISDSQLPEDLRPGPDNPLASEDEKISGGVQPDDDSVVPEGEQSPGEPSIG